MGEGDEGVVVGRIGSDFGDDGVEGWEIAKGGADVCWLNAEGGEAVCDAVAKVTCVDDQCAVARLQRVGGGEVPCEGAGAGHNEGLSCLHPGSKGSWGLGVRVRRGEAMCKVRFNPPRPPRTRP